MGERLNRGGGYSNALLPFVVLDVERWALDVERLSPAPREDTLLFTQAEEQFRLAHT